MALKTDTEIAAISLEDFAGTLELGVLFFISIASGLVISVFVTALLKRKHSQHSNESIEGMNLAT